MGDYLKGFCTNQQHTRGIQGENISFTLTYTIMSVYNSWYCDSHFPFMRLNRMKMTEPNIEKEPDEAGADLHNIIK